MGKCIAYPNQRPRNIGISSQSSEKVKTHMAEVAALCLKINPSIDTQFHQIPISNQVQDSPSFTSNSPSHFMLR
ncbi:hypothetical protein F8M41_025519 [Gigaspora margarita]|uniref:Uncharacterized protein n=1 Tax=Gigaspora margarita TaxID=4874 RepID=A0A8H3XJ35_GIGMA|nr:hypothetical protein F8M41_025519 [Gigaspora margarita]